MKYRPIFFARITSDEAEEAVVINLGDNKSKRKK
jgi:hypothetical protein